MTQKKLSSRLEKHFKKGEGGNVLVMKTAGGLMKNYSCSNLRIRRMNIKTQKKNTVTFSPKANYTYRATAACQRS
jgi:hypothetical protein